MITNDTGMVFLGNTYFKYIFFTVAFLTLIPLIICLMFSKQTKNISRTRSLLEDSSSDKREIPGNIATEPKLVNPAIKTNTAVKDILKPGFDEANNKLCPNLGEQIEILILVTSAPPNILQRRTIRETWGGYAKSQNMSVGFILGKTTNKTDEKTIKIEQTMHHDIIIGRFLDSYDNLTLKSVSIMEWVAKYCPKTFFVLKTDDDVFINIYRLIEVIKTLNPEERVIYGRIARHWKPVRNEMSKYNILLSQFSNEVFPSFTTGPAYIFPAIIAKELYNASVNYNYFKLEDVFLTGVVAGSLNIKRIQIIEMSNQLVSFHFCNVNKLVSIHKVKAQEQRKYWNVLQLPKSKFFCRIFGE